MAAVVRLTVTPATRLALRHAAVVLLSYIVLFCWVFGHLIVRDASLAESDLYDWFLPIFLSPIETWTSAIYAGHPVFADTSAAAQYPVQFLFAQVLRSWDGYVIAGYVLAASFTYAYVWQVTASRWAAWIAGLAFGLSEAMLERQAHINFVHAFAWFPLVLLSIERLLAGASARWVGVGALALACCFLSGHPQPLLYVGLAAIVYGIAGGIATGRGRGWYVRLAGMFVVGGLLTAIKAIPFLQAVPYMSRDTVSFEAFLAQSHTPGQMLGVLFSAVQHNGREAPLYVGVATLMLALAGASEARRHWRAGVWLGTGLFALVVGAGDATPVPRLLYAIPPFYRFRVAARMLFLFAFAAAALAGFGVAAIQREESARRRTRLAAAAVVAVIAAGAAALLWRAAPGVEFELTLPRWDNGIWSQVAIAVATAGLVIRLARAWNARTAAALALLLAADLLYGSLYHLTTAGIRPVTVTAANLEPSIHARRLAAMTAPTHQRLLSYGGTTRDAIVPAGFARLWNVEIAGGYSPLVLDRIAAMARMGSNGDVRREVLAFEDRSLDLLAIRYMTVRQDDFPAPDLFEHEGLPWVRSEFDFPVDYPTCNRPHPQRRRIQLPADVEVASLALIGNLRCAEGIANGETVATVAVLAAGVTVATVPLRAGMEIAERALAEESVRGRAQHGRAPNLTSDPQLPPDQYRVDVRLPHPVRGGTLVLDGAPGEGWMTLERLTLVDTQGRPAPQDLGALLLGNPERWRRVEEFRAARPNVRDQASIQYLGYTVYENRRALPRAWIPSAAAELDDDGMLQAIRSSQKPDGQPWDPRREVLVPPGSGTPPVTADDASARVVAAGSGDIIVDVSSREGGWLVLSEAYYPGWTARIGDTEVEVHRVNFTLQGVKIPPGRQRVVFAFKPAALQAGIAVSGAALVVTLLLVGGYWPRTRRAMRSSDGSSSPLYGAASR